MVCYSTFAFIEKKMKAQNYYYENLLDEENGWEKEDLAIQIDCSMVSRAITVK